MKKFSSTICIILLAVAMIAVSCDSHPTASILGPGQPMESNVSPQLRVEAGLLCLASGAEENCLPLANNLIKMATGEKVLEFSGTESNIPEMPEYLPHPGISRYKGGLRFEMQDEVLHVSGEGADPIDLPLDGSDFGVSGIAGGDVLLVRPCMTGLNISNLTKNPCSGTVKVNPLDVKGGRLLFNSDIGTMIIVDAFDTLNFMLRNLNPHLGPQFMENLVVPEFEVPNVDPLPEDPLDGSEYFTIGDKQLGMSDVKSCTIPCPVKIAWCDGKLIVAGANGKPGCTLKPGNCPFNIYMKNGTAKVVISSQCNSPKVL